MIYYKQIHASLSLLACYALDQELLTGGTHTPGGTREGPRWYVWVGQAGVLPSTTLCFHLPRAGLSGWWEGKGSGSPLQAAKAPHGWMDAEGGSSHAVAAATTLHCRHCTSGHVPPLPSPLCLQLLGVHLLKKFENPYSRCLRISCLKSSSIFSQYQS